MLSVLGVLTLTVLVATQPMNVWATVAAAIVILLAQVLDVPIRSGFYLSFATAFLAAAAAGLPLGSFGLGALLATFLWASAGYLVGSWFSALRMMNIIVRPAGAAGATIYLLDGHVALIVLAVIAYFAVLVEETLFALASCVIDDIKYGLRFLFVESLSLNAIDVTISLPFTILMVLGAAYHPLVLLVLLPPACAAAYLSHGHIQLDAARAELVEAQEAATRDPLTSLLNRRGLEHKLADIDPAARCCIVALDIDHFKQINDSYGHAFGDDVLIAVSRVVQQQARHHDVARIGGEEFVVVLQTDVREAMLLANALRRKLESEPIRDLTVTASFGIAQGAASDLEQTMIRADQALYHSKHSGRNRVTVWSKPGTDPAQGRLAA